MSANLRIVSQQSEQEPTPKRGVVENRANAGRVAGNAKFIVARRPAYPYRLKVCVWCTKTIAPGTLYVMQDRWLRNRGRWFQPGPRHDLCWGLENDYTK